MAALTSSDTIAAIATPPGTGGIGIIRISGPRAQEILQEVFTPSHPHATLKSHTLYHGAVKGSDTRVIDEVLAVFMRAPRTYTREDVVELHSHGSYLVLSAILTEVLRLGARPAEPGEFTKRAFLAGRIDLTRAEAVIDLLQAKTAAGAELAAGQLQGFLFQRIEEIRRGLVDILALLEVAIDFPEDDVELLDSGHLLAQLKERVEAPLAELIAMADRGKIYREGITIVIAGLPNVGKSSLLNALLQEERALVTPVPGTTRDTIEEIISIRGVPVRLIDTAGIRAAAESVEELGIRRARQKVRDADLVLFMVDAAFPLSAEDLELYGSLGDAPRIVVLNKCDLATGAALDAMAARFPDDRPVRISARHHDGLPDLYDVVYRHIMGDASEVREREACAPNIRHRAALEETLAACARLRRALAVGITADLLAVEVQTALASLGDIVGLTTPDEVLDRIFAEFCIGK
ncbi:MAG: tRNA uridine-5-carboxymethylaminomethyl(34) synthesis GTPase MnmE [Desulfobulbaceae bacterium]